MSDRGPDAGLSALPPAQLRAEIRAGRFGGHTAGLAAGRLQVNLVILPERYAPDFAEFCAANSKPCPLISSTQPGQTGWPALGAGIDIRTDVPAYNVYEAGRLSASPTRLDGVWRDDLVSFALGCSFTFEHALLRAGIPVRNIELDLTVPMFRTSIETQPAGPFGGPMVVSMRPIPKPLVDRAVEVSGQFPWAHGTPVHIGDPTEIGIRSLSAPDWGDQLAIGPDEVPVFWACGVTPQAALDRARPDLCITHRPGHMLVTDLDQDDPFSAQAGAA
ncbi:MAG: putative hydro-lyase [Pseudomonadota bacterium]